MKKALTLFGVFISSSVLGGCGDGSDPASVRATRMYWSAGFNENGVIRRADLDGNDVEDVVAVGTNVVGIAVDPVDPQLYWATGFVIPFGKLQHASLDGGDAQDLLSDLPFPYAVAIDRQNDKIYWTEILGRGAQDGRIRRANLDGSAVENLVDGRFAPGAIAVDPSHDAIYWNEFGPLDGPGTVWRANLDGSDARRIVNQVAFENGGEGGIAVDTVANRIYWTTDTSIQHARVDGSDTHSIPTCVNPSGIALDVPAGKMYWACFVDQTIQRADLDGGALEQLVADPEIPHFIALAAD